MSQKVLEVFGKFAVDLGEGAVLFDTQAEAETALVEYEKGAEHRELAAKYCAYAGIEADSKNAKGKSNVITSFLSWVEAGTPEPAPAEEASEEVADAPAGEVQF